MNDPWTSSRGGWRIVDPAMRLDITVTSFAAVRDWLARNLTDWQYRLDVVAMLQAGEYDEAARWLKPVGVAIHPPKGTAAAPTGIR